MAGARLRRLRAETVYTYFTYHLHGRAAQLKRKVRGAIWPESHRVCQLQIERAKRFW